MTNSQTILVPSHFQQEISDRLPGSGIRLIPYDKEGRPLEPSEDATGLFRWWLSTTQGDQLIEMHPHLDWIHTGSTGVNHILTPLFRERGITLTSSRGVHAPSIAEWVLAGILHVEKRLDLVARQQMAREWKQLEVPEISSLHVVLLGGGAIGSAIAARLQPFGCRITIVTRSGRSDAPGARVVPVSALPSVAADADWLIVAVPSTPETRGLVSAEVLRSMPAAARIVNVARGEIIDEAALEETLIAGRLAGAILDVFEKEPLPEESPLWTMPEVMVLPHTTWKSPQVRERQIALFVRNAIARAEGRPLENMVNVERGY